MIWPVASPSPLFTRSAFHAVLAAIVLAAPPARAQEDACTAGPHTEIISSEEISQFALGRLTDVFAFSTRWHAASVDGYHWQATPRGLTPGAAGWTVYVDDVPVALRLLGRNQLNALPLPIFDIDCIELVGGPDLRHTAFSPAGSIRIYTKRPNVGLSLEGAAAVGNETNDPGPFRYTGTGGENVDRVGPIATAGISVNTHGWAGRAGGRLDEYHVTDPAIYERVRHYHRIPKPKIQAASIGLTGAAGPAAARHRFLLGTTTTRDLAFFEPIGLEIPADQHLQVAGGSGRLPLSGGTIRYAASYTRSQLAAPAGDTDPDWSHDHVTVDGEVDLQHVRLGGGLRAADVETNHQLFSSRILTSRLFAGFNRSITPTWRQALYLEWKQRDDRPSAAAYASTDIRLDANHAVTLLASYRHVLPDDQDLWMWLGRGYLLPVTGSTNISPLERRTLPRLLTLDGTWEGALAEDLRGSVQLFYRRINHAYLPVFERAYEPETSGYSVITGLRADGRGTAAGGEVTLRHTIAPFFRHRLSYVLEAVTDGTEAYRNVRARIPTQRITYAASLTHLDRFSLSTLIRYTSAAQWPSYDVTEPDPPHAWELPAYFLVDVSATKRMWRDHLLLALALRNVLDEPVRFHPAGSAFHMALHFSIRVNVTAAAGM